MDPITPLTKQELENRGWQMTTVENPTPDPGFNLYGATYVGVASPDTVPETPTNKAFYLTTQEGTYTNFGNLTVESGKLTVLLYNGSTWEKQVLDLPASGGGSTVNVVQTTGDSEEDVMSQKAVTEELGQRQAKPSESGTAGQVLTKTGPNPGDVEWQDPSGGGLSEGAEQALAESSNNLEQRIAALEKFIYAVVTGEAVIPKLQVKILNAYDENSIVKRGTGAPTVPPDFAGQFYVDTEAPAVYFAKANNKVSDWTNL